MRIAILGVKQLSYYKVPSGGSGRAVANTILHSKSNIYFVYQLVKKEKLNEEFPDNVHIIPIHSVYLGIFKTFFFFALSARVITLNLKFLPP